MSDQIEAAAENAVEASEPKKGGSSFGGFVGTVGGAAAGGHFTNKYLQDRGIKRVLDADAKKTEKFEKFVGESLDGATPESKTRVEAKETLSANKSAVEQFSKDVGSIKEATFVQAADKTHSLHVTNAADEKIAFDGLKKLPKDVAANATLDADQIKKVFEGEKSYASKLVKNEEKALIGEIRGSGKYFKNVKNLSLGEGAMVASGIVAAGVVGNKVVHAIFGGKHTNTVNAPQEQAVGAGR